MDFDEDPLDLLEDDGDGVNEMCLLFDKDGDNQNAQQSPQGTGCVLLLFCIGLGALFAGILADKIIA